MLKPVILLICGLVAGSLLHGQQKLADSLLNVTKKPVDDTGKVIAYRGLTGITLNTDPVLAISYARKGIALGKQLKFDKGVAGCYLNMSAAYSSAGKLDSSLLYIDTAIIWSHKVGEPARLALAYLNRADMKMLRQNFKGSLLDCDTSLFYAEKAQKNDTKARVFQTIGSVYYGQDNFEKSNEYYQRAYQMYEQGGNTRMMAITMNNIGNVNKHLKNYDRAIGNFNEALAMAEKAGDQNNRPMYFSNLADVYLEKGDFVLAEKAARQSLQYARENKNEMQTSNTLNVLTNIYLKTNRVNEARTTALECFELSSRNHITNVKQNTAEQLAEVYFKLGDFKQAHTYQSVSKELADTLARQRFEEDVAALQAGYQLKEKESQIALLAAENQLHQQKLKEDRLLITGSIIIVGLLLTGILLLMNRNRIRQRVKELELRTRIASDLHDEVGSSLSSIHLLSQMIKTQPESDKRTQLFDTMSRNVKETVEKMTEMVWMIKPEETEKGNLQQRMERFAYDICAGKDVDLDLDLGETGKDRLSMEQRKNLYLIFKEAVNNAVKYSGTQKLFAALAIKGNELQMTIADEGRGFDLQNTAGGNGIGNMRTRARELNAQLDITSTPGKGTTIRLKMPV